MQGSEIPTQDGSRENSAPSVYSPTDVRFHRATFKTRYPKDAYEFQTKKSLEKLKIIEPGHSKHDVHSKHVYLRAREAKIEDVTWTECRFHWPQDTTISDIKFQRCAFSSCFFGSVEFNRTTFQDCQFKRCEFSFTRFIECNFENCTWEECTLWDAQFKGTLADPDAVLKGFRIPRDNLISIGMSEKTTRLKLLLQSRVDLAEQLSRSNDERRSAVYSDRAIAAHRKEQLILRSDRRKERAYRVRWYYWLKDLPSSLFFHLTNGGVSLQRLFVVAIVAVLTTSVLLRFIDSHILYRGVDLNKDFPKSIEASLGLIFSFGYELFTVEKFDFPSFLVAVPIIGIFWMAITLAVVVRRVYR